MKNILITVITVLITVLIIVLMVRGLEIGNLKILSVSEIKENSEELDKKIENLNTLKNATYKKRVSDLETSIKNLTKSKKEYLDIASTSTESEIKEANQEQTYAMEFLWNKVGSYATSQGVNLKWVVTPTGTENKNKLTFTAVGSYIGIINYVYALENDSELLFKIENFKIVSGDSTEALTATFDVLNIAIKQESAVNNVSSGITESTMKEEFSDENNINDTTDEKQENTEKSNSVLDEIDEAVQ